MMNVAQAQEAPVRTGMDAVVTQQAGVASSPSTQGSRAVRPKRRIQLVSMTPLRGNNPLNAVDPINNRTVNGRVIQQPVDRLDL